MYIISVMIFTYSIRDFGHPLFLKSHFGHSVMKISAKSLNYRACNSFFFQGAQLYLPKLTEVVVYRNQHIFGLPSEISLRSIISITVIFFRPQKGVEAGMTHTQHASFAENIGYLNTPRVPDNKAIYSLGLRGPESIVVMRDQLGLIKLF